jgi:hypothetical protein
VRKCRSLLLLLLLLLLRSLVLVPGTAGAF